MSAYYKTNHPDVMAAIEVMRDQMTALQTATKAMADHFGGKAYFVQGIHGSGFGGIRFTPTRDKMLWTVPDRNDGQQPRAKPRPGATDAQKAEHAKLRADWAAMKPKGGVRPEALYTALGCCWSDFLFNGIGYAERDGWLYVTTKAKLNDRVTEILASEYSAATKEPQA